MTRKSEPVIAENLASLPSLRGKTGRVLAISMADWSRVYCDGVSAEEVHRQMAEEFPGEAYFTYAVPDFSSVELGK